MKQGRHEENAQLEFEHEELKVKFEEQAEKMEKFRQCAKEKIEARFNRF